MDTVYIRYIGNRSAVELFMGGRRRIFKQNVAVTMTPGEANSILASKPRQFERCGEPEHRVVSSTPKQEPIPQSYEQMSEEQRSHIRRRQNVVTTENVGGVVEVTSQTPPTRSLDDGEPAQNSQPSAQTDSGESGSDDDTTNANKAALDLAAEHEIDISQVEGTGKNGKVTKPDVERFMADQAEARAAAVNQKISDDVHQ